jgi:superfamily I DNA/RNA helicase
MGIKRQKALYVFLVWLDKVEKTVKGMTVENKLRSLSEQLSIQGHLNENRTLASSFDRLLDISRPFGEDSHAFVHGAALESDTDAYDSRAETVSLMTLHAAKGLEFPIVFITGCEDGLIPFHHPDTHIDEERRLFYVAMTRAKERLYLTMATNRRIYGKKTPRSVSPFVADIEQQFRKHENTPAKKIKPDAPVQMNLF